MTQIQIFTNKKINIVSTKIKPINFIID